MKNILIPTDFSPLSNAACKVGLELAKMNNAEIHFLHIFSAPINWKELRPEQEDLYPEIKKDFHNANNSLDALVKAAKKKGVSAERFMLFNEGRKAIDDHIKDHKHDFVVIGSHGTGGVKDIIGSNAQKVVRNSHAPVLVLKNEDSFLDCKSIVFASNFSQEVLPAFSRVAQLATVLDSKVHLLYVNVPGQFKETEEIETTMTKFLNKCENAKCSIHIHDALNVERGILNFANTSEADLIALATHGKSVLMNLISPSIAEGVVNKSKIPVLSINVG